MERNKRFRNSKGQHYIVLKNSLVKCYQGKKDAKRIKGDTYKRRRLNAGENGLIKWVFPKRELIWIQCQNQTLVIPFEEARRVGGTFNSELEAQVAFQSGKVLR